MTDVLKHRFVSPHTDGSDLTQVQPSAWNDGHKFIGGAEGDVLTRSLADPSFGAAWRGLAALLPVTTYTPDWFASPTNPAIGNGTLTGRSIVLGKLVYVRILMTAGTTTTFGSGGWLFSLPQPIDLNGVFAGGIALINIYATAVHGAYKTGPTQINPFAGAVGVAGVSMDATHPAAWGATSWLDFHVLYTTP